MSRRPLGLTVLSLFFLCGALMAFLAVMGLLFPDRAIESIWKLNRHAQVALMELQWGGVALMIAVGVACALTAIGLWVRAQWSRTLALALLALNMVGDVLNAALRGDVRTLIGIPVAGAIILYLLTSRIRAEFGPRPTDAQTP